MDCAIQFRSRTCTSLSGTDLFARGVIRIGLSDPGTGGFRQLYLLKHVCNFWNRRLKLIIPHPSPAAPHNARVGFAIGPHRRDGGARRGTQQDLIPSLTWTLLSTFTRLHGRSSSDSRDRLVSRVGVQIELCVLCRLISSYRLSSYTVLG